MDNFITEVNVGNNYYWSGTYEVCSAEDYKDSFGGTINGVDTRYLEIPCNKPWSLVTCKVFEETYTLDIAFFDGTEVHEHTYEERTYFKNAVADVCSDFLDDELNIEPEAIPGLIEVLDACLVDVSQHPEEVEDSDEPEDSDASDMPEKSDDFEEFEIDDSEEDDID